jgi:hypothetical protein
MKKVQLVLLLTLSAILPLGSAVFASDDGLPSTPTVTADRAPGSNRTPGSLTTHFNGGNGYAGNMFDILPSFDMFVTAIDINNEGVGTTCQVEVWWRSGTCVGFENSQAGWNTIGIFTGTGAGGGIPTFIDMNGNGVTFTAGQTYGLYVNLISYGSGADRLTYSNGGPTVFSNSALSLTTYCGKGTPDFGGSTFIPREWNGTIYYDNATPVIPEVDIKCNGGDSGVMVPAGTNVKIDFAVTAGSAAGTPVDIWVAMTSPFGPFSFDGIGPVSGWWPGLGHTYHTGPLADVAATALNRPIPFGAWEAHVGIDIAPNGVLDIGSVVVYDVVDILVF